LLLPSGKPRQLCSRAFFQKHLKILSLYWPKNYHDPLHSLFVAIFLIIHGLMNNPAFLFILFSNTRFAFWVLAVIIQIYGSVCNEALAAT
jgi:hypothetical protein